MAGPRGTCLAEKLIYVLVLVGRWDEAEAVALDVVDLCYRASRRWTGLVPVLIRRGQFDAARRVIADIRARPSDNPGDMPAWRYFELELHTTARITYDAVDLVDSLMQEYGSILYADVVSLADTRPRRPGGGVATRRGGGVA